jgi:hypothetical protein
LWSLLFSSGSGCTRRLDSLKASIIGAASQIYRNCVSSFIMVYALPPSPQQAERKKAVCGRHLRGYYDTRELTRTVGHQER